MAGDAANNDFEALNVGGEEADLGVHFEVDSAHFNLQIKGEKAS